MMVATAQISESLQMLIDSRLDTIDRMLLGRLSRQDRMAIVREVESQIHELIQVREADDLTREDVLAVLARLDPPEAYLPNEIDGAPVTVQRAAETRAIQPALQADLRAGRASGILGVAAIAFLLVMLPFSFLIAIAFGSEAVLFILGGVTLLLASVAATVGLVLGVSRRERSLGHRRHRHERAGAAAVIRHRGHCLLDNLLTRRGLTANTRSSIVSSRQAFRP